MLKPIDFKGAWTLDQYVISLFEKKLTDTPEFKTMLEIYGRDRIEKIWREYVQAKRKSHEFTPSGIKRDETKDHESSAQTQNPETVAAEKKDSV